MNATTHHDPPLSPAEAQALAERCAEAMYARDRASQGLGMQVGKVGPGFAAMTMTVRADMLNGHATCHGGFIFALADSAFAYACNSHNQVALATSCMIDFLSPGQIGDVLAAEATEQNLRGRFGVYDIRVTNQKGELIALFRGKSAQLKDQVVPA